MSTIVKAGTVLTNTHLIQAFRAIGMTKSMIYLSVPITSGLREIELLLETGLSVSEFRSQQIERWHSEVINENCKEAQSLVQVVRARSHSALVIDPSELSIQGWSQDDYNGFWVNLMEQYAERVVVAKGWEFSRGARGEVAFALYLHLPIETVEGTELKVDDIKMFDDAATSALLARGWDHHAVRSYLPELDTSQRPSLLPSPASRTFQWLIEERNYQLSKFGTAQDDAHTATGLGYEDWWWKQLTNYYHRALTLGLDVAVGRQALAKFVATGCGLLESAIRTRGPLPAPGVTSGETGGMRE